MFTMVGYIYQEKGGDAMESIYLCIRHNVYLLDIMHLLKKSY